MAGGEIPGWIIDSRVYKRLNSLECCSEILSRICWSSFIREIRPLVRFISFEKVVDFEFMISFSTNLVSMSDQSSRNISDLAWSAICRDREMVERAGSPLLVGDNALCFANLPGCRSRARQVSDTLPSRLKTLRYQTDRRYRRSAESCVLPEGQNLYGYDLPKVGRTRIGLAGQQPRNLSAWHQCLASTSGGNSPSGWDCCRNPGWGAKAGSAIY